MCHQGFLVEGFLPAYIAIRILLSNYAVLMPNMDIVWPLAGRCIWLLEGNETGGIRKTLFVMWKSFYQNKRYTQVSSTSKDIGRF